MAIAAEVGRGAEGTVAAGGVVEVVADLVVGGVGEAGVDVVDGAEGEAVDELRNQVVVVEEDGLPQAVELEGLADVVVGAAIGQARHEGVGIFVVGAGAGVHGLGVVELGVELDAVGHVVLEAEEQ